MSHQWKWSEAQWSSVALMLDGGFPGHFDAVQDAAYRMRLEQFEPQEVADVVGAMMDSLDFRPKIKEIVKAVKAKRGDLEALGAAPWREVLPVAERAAYRFLNRPAEGAKWIREQLGETPAAWFASGGRARILAVELGDSQYAAKNARELGEDYAQFCQHAQDAASLALPSPWAQAQIGRGQ